MELYFQFGWGMMEHSRVLLSRWKGGSVILSPRDLYPEQLEPLSSTINALPGTSVLVDPQFYLPYADHERLCSHAYWPQDYDTGDFWQGSGLEQLLEELIKLNIALESRAFVLPGMLASEINEDWLATQRSVLETARTLV